MARRKKKNTRPQQAMKACAKQWKGMKRGGRGWETAQLMSYPNFMKQCLKHRSV